MTNAAETPQKPLPDPTEEGLEPFWQATLEGKLMLKRCTNCAATMLPYRDTCDQCLLDDLEWMEASGRGQLASWAIMHQRYHPAFEPEIPYAIAVVELEEGPRLPTNVVGVGHEELRIGMPLVVEWERHDDLALPKFRPA